MSKHNWKHLRILLRDIPRNPPPQKVLSANSFLQEHYGNIHTIVELPYHGQLGLIQKVTPYVTNQADTMVAPMYRKISLLDEFKTREGIDYFAFLGRLAGIFLSILGDGIPIVAINQQALCNQIPRKYIDDVDLKVQTWNQFHAHVFLEDFSGTAWMQRSTIPLLERKNFFDPLSMAASELALRQVDTVREVFLPETELNLSKDHFPLGITLKWHRNIESAFDDPALFLFMRTVQTSLFKMYNHFMLEYLQLENPLAVNTYLSALSRESAALRKKAIIELIQKNQFSIFTEKILMVLANNLRSWHDEKLHYLRIIPGPAMTWLIFQEFDQVVINLSFRILSRGNASEALGIYTRHDQFADSSRLIELNDFHHLLSEKLKRKYTIFPGPLIAH